MNTLDPNLIEAITYKEGPYTFDFVAIPNQYVISGTKAIVSLIANPKDINLRTYTKDGVEHNDCYACVSTSYIPKGVRVVSIMKDQEGISWRMYPDQVMVKLCKGYDPSILEGYTIVRSCPSYREYGVWVPDNKSIFEIQKDISSIEGVKEARLITFCIDMYD